MRSERNRSGRATHRSRLPLRRGPGIRTTGPKPGDGGRIAWKVNSEIVLLLGWGRAILLQFAHPLVAAGVADHSIFAAEPGTGVYRLQRTLAAMFALTFGTPEEAARTAHAINAIHNRVRGTLREPAGVFPAGTLYAARDPALLGWVHATLLDTFPRTYELFVGPLTAEEKDRYCAEANGIATLLGVTADYLPQNWAELQAYLQTLLASGEIVVTDTARALARDLLAPPSPPVLWPLLWFMRLVTIGLLPPVVRQGYGFTWDRRHEVLLQRAATGARFLLPWLPSLIRYWPAARRAWRRAQLH